LAFVIGVTVVWLTVLGFESQGHPDLAVALLVVLAEVLVVAALSGPWLAVVAALSASLLVNWYLVPPYRTIAVANPENLAALVVFTLVAVFSSWLVELAVRARLDAGATRAQARPRRSGLPEASGGLAGCRPCLTRGVLGPTAGCCSRGSIRLEEAPRWSSTLAGGQWVGRGRPGGCRPPSSPRYEAGFTRATAWPRRHPPPGRGRPCPHGAAGGSGP
jgi:hypothetical protein